MSEPLPVRPPVFATVDLAVYRDTNGARISFGGLSVHVSESEARALCTALRDALDDDKTPTLKGVPR